MLGTCLLTAVNSSGDWPFRACYLGSSMDHGFRCVLSAFVQPHISPVSSSGNRPTGLREGWMWSLNEHDTSSSVSFLLIPDCPKALVRLFVAEF